MSENNISLLFPVHLREEIHSVISALPKADLEPVFENTKVYLKGEELLVDCRIYNDFPAFKDIESFTVSQNLMLSALYTKHYDGYVREKNLKDIIDQPDYWIPPFVFHVIGEHVPDLTELIFTYRHVLYKMDTYVEFAKENPSYMHLQLQRCISYWDAYSRDKYPSKAQFPGVEFIENFITK